MKDSFQKINLSTENILHQMGTKFMKENLRTSAMMVKENLQKKINMSTKASLKITKNVEKVKFIL